MTTRTITAHRQRVVAARERGELKARPRCSVCFMLSCIKCRRLMTERPEEYGDIEAQHCQRHCRRKNVELESVPGMEYHARNVDKETTVRSLHVNDLYFPGRIV